MGYEISLTKGMRANLISLQLTDKLITATQNRLSTGKKVNTAMDDPVNFFAAQTHLTRAADLASRKDGVRPSKLSPPPTRVLRPSTP
jgi:hypothetical protein